MIYHTYYFKKFGQCLHYFDYATEKIDIV